MTRTNQNPKQNAKQNESQKKPFVIVNFLDIDTSLFTFMEPKPNAHGGRFVKLRYDGKQLYVRYGSHVCPFGISVNTQNMDPKEAEKYPDGKKTTGYSTSISLPKNYKEGDPYFEKAKELDEFFMNACIENSILWGLGGSEERAIDPYAIKGYDPYGKDGKWKRILKYAYKKTADNKRIYQDYPPRMEFGVPHSQMQEEIGSDGKLHVTATFKTNFYDSNSEEIADINSANMAEFLPNWSHVGLLTSWATISLGQYGASLKPKVEQMRISPPDRFHADECLLDSDDEDDFNEDIPMALGTLEAPTPVTKVSGAAKTSVPSAAKPAPASTPASTPATTSASTHTAAKTSATSTKPVSTPAPTKAASVPTPAAKAVASKAAPAPAAKAPPAKGKPAPAPVPVEEVEEEVIEEEVEEEVVEEVEEEVVEEEVVEEEVEEVPPPVVEVKTAGRRTVISKKP
jgi:hypothetical protein